jgi:ABC-type nitrate/sulfonate/bicarbonate transport system substrate-binding protein
MDTLRIRFLRYSAFYSPLLLTMAHLREEGIEASFDVATPTNTIPAGIRDGSVQVAQSALAVSFGPHERGEPLPFRHFATMNRHDGFFLVGRGIAPGDGWAALRGKRVLVDHFFQPLAMFKAALRARGIGEHELTLVDAGDPAAMERAYRAGEADVLHAQGPAPQQLEVEGLGAVFASVGEAVGPVVFSTLCASPEWLATDAARAFARAFERGRAQAQQAPPAEIAALVAGYFPQVGRAALERTIADYQRLGCWNGDMAITPELHARTLDVFLASGDIRGAIPLEALVA